MCLIVDANRASVFFQFPPLPQFRPLWQWLNGRHGYLVVGGALATELSKVRAAAAVLAELVRAGRAHLEPATRVSAEMAELPVPCKSNDAHVVALARVTGARLLCSEDVALIADFKDLRLVPRPGGKVYQDESHASLFAAPGNGHCRGCRGRAAGKG